MRQLLSRKARKQLAEQRLFGQKAHQCPCCKKGKMTVVVDWKRNKSPPKWVSDMLQHDLT